MPVRIKMDWLEFSLCRQTFLKELPPVSRERQERAMITSFHQLAIQEVGGHL